MAALFTTIFVVLSGNIIILTCGLLVVVTQLLLSSEIKQIGLAQIILFYLTIMAIPVAAYVASALVEKVAMPAMKRGNLSVFCFVITCALCLQSNQVPEFFYAAKQITQVGSLFGVAVFVAAISNACLMAGSMVALSILLVQLLFELPALWFCNALGFTRKPEISFLGLRMLVMLTSSLMGIQLIISFLTTKLWPTVFTG